MLRRLIMNIVDWCWRHAVLVVIAAALITVGFGYYAATSLGINTDDGQLISAELPFRKAERRMDQAFPQNSDVLVVVVDAPTPGQADEAVSQLISRLEPRKDLFRSLRRPAEEVFFHKNGLLFLSPEDLTELSDKLAAAQPLIGTLAPDPSLRGLLASLNLALEGVAQGAMEVKDLAPLVERLDNAAAVVATGKPAPIFAWQSVFSPSSMQDTPRRFLLAQPILNYKDLVAGRAASEAVRGAAQQAGFTADKGYRVRLTGSVALADANFSTVTEGVEISTPLMILAVCVLLYFAVRSVRVMISIWLSLVVGLAATAAFAALTVGTLNPISVAFAVMFVGIAVDFAIQFVVRYRDERYGRPDDPILALRSCAGKMAVPLTIAAVTTAIGFLSFLPTAYTGVSQLGLIAGGGMIIALVVDFTVLPALLALLPPPRPRRPFTLPLAAADLWLARHCRPVLGVAVALAIAGAALLPALPLDFNPLHLQNPKAEAVATFNDLIRDRDSGSYAVNALAPSVNAAVELAKRFDELPEVRRTMTIDTFVPEQQNEKLAILNDLALLLGPSLEPAETLPPPSAADLLAALKAAADRLEATVKEPGPARNLAEHLRQVAARGGDAAQALQTALLTGLPAQLDQLRTLLEVKPITLDTLPEDVRSNWVTPNGEARVQAQPRDDMQNEDALIAFVSAVRSVSPDAAGLPIVIEQAGQVVVDAFVKAGTSALLAIGLLLWVMLRRVVDALLVVLPLVMGACYTVLGCILFGLAINFANIIALPLLLGIGVAFNIYFVVNWRNGVTRHLQSATTRAVLFSALTTGSAFGSLAISPHLGTASMGLLLFLSLGLSVLTTFTVLPAVFCALAKARVKETAS